MNADIILSFIITFILSLILVPIVRRITTDAGIIAQTNQRTIHTGTIPRTGGYAIYISFLVVAMIFLKTDIQINSMLIGGFIVFIVGFYDDIHDLRPRYKILGQVIAALIVIFYGGISLKDFTIPFLPSSLSYVIAIAITVLWIVGITNAVNLIDGLDGLCAGISIIVLFTISMISLTYGRTDISSLSLLLAGSIAGFLVYNFHPASIFLGDCGSLFIGFMIAVISLLGFGYKSSTFFTLGAPIVVLMVPIMDTLIAIVRRRVHHRSISEADKNHTHHVLMFKLELGQTKSVLVLYVATILFSLCAYFYLYDKISATILFIILMLIFEIFVEYTEMIDRRYRPVLTLLNIFLKNDDLPKIKDTKPYHRLIENERYFVIIAILLGLIGITGYGIYALNNQPSSSTVQPEIFEYVIEDNATDLMENIYNQLTIAFENNNKESECQLVSAYFVSDYFTLSNKETDEVGGMDYFYADRKESFIEYAQDDYYEDANRYISLGLNNQTVTSYSIESYGPSDIVLEDLEDYSYYDVGLLIDFSEYNEIVGSDELKVVVHLILKDQKFSVVALDY